MWLRRGESSCWASRYCKVRVPISVRHQKPCSSLISALASHSPMGGLLSSLCRCFLVDQRSNDVPASCCEESGGASVREAYSSVEGMSEMEISCAIEKSKEQGWSEVREGASSSGGLDDSAIWEELKATYPRFFKDNLGVKLGRLIAEGGQAHIYEAMIPGNEFVVKVFKTEGFCLTDLKRQWPLATKTPKEVFSEKGFVLGGVVFGEFMMNCSWSYCGTFLEDRRFAFVMERYWGDLRTLIDLKLTENNSQEPPFSHYQARYIMESIAWGMKELHDRGILHRDLKAANVLVHILPNAELHSCHVGDYESSMMVQGTAFWRAPEVLEDLMKLPRDRNPKIWTEKVDVYRYAMTCYEILTGLTPFEGYLKSDWDKIIKGERLPWPKYVDSRLQELVERCWHKEPSKRPTFEVMINMLFRIKFEEENKAFLKKLMMMKKTTATKDEEEEADDDEENNCDKR